MCDRWKNFRNFLADMGERPDGTTLDRKDNDAHYCKENCKWATKEEQVSNRSSNVFITFDGVTLTKAQWAEKIGCTRYFLQNRLSRGWSVERALTEPPRDYGKAAL